MALFWRIWAAVSLVNVLVLSVFLGLAALQFASINFTLVGERLVVLANRTAAPFAASVRLGLPISGVRNVPALLERARQTDEDIVLHRRHEHRIIYGLVRATLGRGGSDQVLVPKRSK